MRTQGPGSYRRHDYCQFVYFFFGDFKGSKSAKVDEQPPPEGKAVAAEKK